MKRKLLVMAAVDFAIVFAMLILSKWLLEGAFPRWYILALTSAVWALCGFLTHKLEFWRYSRRKYAVLTIAIVDAAVYTLSLVIWRVSFPERSITASQFWPLPFLIAAEYVLYEVWRLLFKKLPYLYEDNIDQPYHERGIDNATSYMDSADINNDLTLIFESTEGMSHEASCKWILEHTSQFSPRTKILETDVLPDVGSAEKPFDLIVSLRRFNDIRHFNSFLAESNKALKDGGMIVMSGETSGMRRCRILSKYPIMIGDAAAFMDYVWSRVLIKLTLTRRMCMILTRGKNRNFPRAEVLGRIARAGFRIQSDEIRNGRFTVTAIKTKEPASGNPHYGIFIRLPRKGKGGKQIGVFKLRTMYAYSEYIQDYAYKLNGLEPGGKLKNDFRVNRVGAFCRSRFLDELPMFINLFNGDLKLVGVRPLSNHYLSLYSPEMKNMHLSVKPGIFPPLYYEYPKPQTLDEIQESEKRYIERFNRHPFQTDWIYFWTMLKNILFKRERSH